MNTRKKKIAMESFKDECLALYMQRIKKQPKPDLSYLKISAREVPDFSRTLVEHAKDDNIYEADRKQALLKIDCFYTQLYSKSHSNTSGMPESTIKQLVLELACNILDRAASNPTIKFNLSSKTIADGTYNYNLIAIVSTFIAFKFYYDEQWLDVTKGRWLSIFRDHCPSDWNTLLFIARESGRISDDARFGKGVMSRCEKFILKTIDWRIAQIITPQTLLSIFIHHEYVSVENCITIRAYTSDEDIHDRYSRVITTAPTMKTFQTISTQILYDALIGSYEFAMYSPEIVAISATIIAIGRMESLSHTTCPKFLEKLKLHCNYDVINNKTIFTSLKSCLNAFRQMYCSPNPNFVLKSTEKGNFEPPFVKYNVPIFIPKDTSRCVLYLNSLIECSNWLQSCGQPYQSLKPYLNTVERKPKYKKIHRDSSNIKQKRRRKDSYQGNAKPIAQSSSTPLNNMVCIPSVHRTTDVDLIKPVKKKSYMRSNAFKQYEKTCQIA